MNDLPLMDDLLEWLALGFWMTLMDVLEMVRFFIIPHHKVLILTKSVGSQ